MSHDNENKKCLCACHINKLKKPYEHDTKCCDEMNGFIPTPPSEVSTEWHTKHATSFFNSMQLLLEIAEGKTELEEWNQIVTDCYLKNQTIVSEIREEAKREENVRICRDIMNLPYFKQVFESTQTLGEECVYRKYLEDYFNHKN